MARRVRYAVVSSLDGYIAGPKGEADWIIMSPGKDFGSFFRQFDTVLVGRRTFEVMVQAGQYTLPGMKTWVVSHSLASKDYPDVSVVNADVEQRVSELKQQPGKDIWLFGGGQLFRSLLPARLVDTIEVAIMPILLGGGIPLLPSPAERAKLRLTAHNVDKAGIVCLEYAVE